ncbi:MAG: protein kinase [Acidobacteria bacterium]|nr:protein kinase [Acidobacteriota bacterium]
MSLKSGQRLGPYEIESPLGAGGMGEVYRAQDTRLGRSVAIKVLPAHLAEHPQRRERFEREAKAVAALSHPHICALYDVGEEDGVSFLVMEHLEGESLAERLSRGALRLDQLLKIGAEVAGALDRAHRAGIAHRDLKPGNVMLTKSGAKLLDFGLAKSGLAEPERTESSAPTEAAPGVAPQDTSAPTEAKPPLTEAGAVLGTFQYMAPEQLEGEEADARADIWALGCLLYEMATGSPPFAGKSQASLISSIMRDVPVPVGERQPLTPSSLEHVIARCLEKDREDRWQSAHDVAEELTWIQRAGGRDATPSVEAGKTPRRPGTSRMALAAAAAAVAGAVLGYALGWGRTETTGAASWSAQQLTFQKGVENHPALSPDGRQVAYVSEASGNADIYLQRVDGRNAINLTKDSPAADTEPAFSPDGSQIVFRSERGGGGIFVMGATGESVRRIGDLGYNPSWSPDGRRVVVSTERVADPLSRQATAAELWTVDLTSGETRRIYAGDSVQPAWSPDGRWIAFWRVDGNSGQRDLATIDAEGTGESAAVTTDVPVDWNPVWSPDGRHIYFVSDRAGTMNVWRVAIDPETGGADSEPVMVGTPAEDVAWLSVAREGGNLAYVSRSALHYLHSFPLDPERLRPAGEARTVLAGALPIRYTHPSPDGASIALTTAGSREDLYVLQSDGGEFRQLTDDPFRDRGPQWSPDGSEIAFYSNRSGTYQVWSIRPDGSGLRQLTDVADGAWFPYWSPDGKRIAFPTGRGTCLVTVGDAPVSTAECLPDLSADQWYEVRDWSHDGRWLVGNASLRAGAVRPDLLLWSFDAEEYQPIEHPGFVARWLPDSRNLVVIGDDGRLTLVDHTTGTARDVGRIESSGTVDREQMGLSRDGRTVLAQAKSLEANIWVLSPPEDSESDD